MPTLNLRNALVASLVVALAASPVTTAAQAAVALPLSEVPIPQGHYKSWSIFIICNPSWLLPQNEQQLQELYDQFLAYGEAIGPDHAAIWFWSEKPRQPRQGKLDTARNAYFCARLELAPSKSPYLVFTTHYPGAALLADYPATFPSMSDLQNHFVLSLDGASAANTTRVLSKLADKLVVGKLNNVAVDSREYWSTWQTAYEGVRDEITGLVGRVTVTFDTGFVKTEVKLSK